MTSFHRIHCARYFLYYDYLVRQQGRFDSVMLSDVRDVFFQADPFASALPRPLLFFLESRDYCIGTEPYNCDWTRRLYGWRVLSALAERRIACSGVTMGREVQILHYLELMCDELARLTGRIRQEDQGVHNYLIWGSRFPDAAILENGRSPVLTMGLEAPERFRAGPDGMLLNDDGSKVAVVHQYDRHPHYAERLLRQLPVA